MKERGHKPKNVYIYLACLAALSEPDLRSYFADMFSVF